VEKTTKMADLSGTYYSRLVTKYMTGSVDAPALEIVSQESKREVRN